VSSAIFAVVVRELTRFQRQRGRLLAALARPLLWLVVIGAGFERLVPTQGTVSYKQFLLPGLFGMVILFSTMLSALATVHDREFGPIRMLLVAPVPRYVTVLAKTLSATILGLIQTLILFPLIWILGLRPSLGGVAELIGGIAIGSFALASVGMLIASRLRSLENFSGIMNFLMFPMFFLSSALYPASLLPSFLQPIVRVDPLTYAIDLMRHPLLNGLYPGNLGTDYTASFDLLVLGLMSIVLLALASLLFGEEHHLTRILLLEPPRRRARRGALERLADLRSPGREQGLRSARAGPESQLEPAASAVAQAEAVQGADGGANRRPVIRAEQPEPTAQP
jgi:ABC-2 type transport system permease protein